MFALVDMVVEDVAEVVGRVDQSGVLLGVGPWKHYVEDGIFDFARQEGLCSERHGSDELQQGFAEQLLTVVVVLDLADRVELLV